ncbi:MAG: methyl-accepting chemotaxis protein [Polyangiales bacterium]
MRIGYQIGFGYAVALLLMVTLGVLGYVNTQGLIGDSRWVTHTHAVLENIERLGAGLREQDAALRSLMLTNSGEYLEISKMGEARGRAALEEIARLTVDNAAQQRRVSEMRSLVNAQRETWSSSVNDFQQRGYEAGRDSIRGGAGKRGLDAITLLLSAMSDEETRLLGVRTRATDETTERSVDVLIWGTALAIGLTLVLAVLLVRGITTPLRQLSEGAAHIGAGNLGYRVAIERRDEIGTLATALNKMAEDLGKNLTTIAGERQARERTEGLIATIAETANDLVSATAEILAATTQQSAGAQEQAAAVAQTVTTVNAVVQTSEQAADRARSVAETAQRSLEVSRTGRRVIEESVQAMGAVKERVEASTEGILSLAEQAQSIGAIITTVTEIAEQTNLLALNAAIEASRAGEQGRGFGVVAAEIKALAGQSKKATQQVRQILGEIQRATNGAVMSTEECGKSVNGAVAVIVQAGDTIRSLAEVINQAFQAASQIAASAGQQAAGTAQIHQAMQNIDQVTVQNLGSTRQMEQAAKDLNLLGGRLRERLTRVERGAAAVG